MAESLTDVRDIDHADVYKGDVRAGALYRDGSDIVFAYAADYLGDPTSLPLSWSIPLRAESVRSSGESAPPFFAGLLPEGARLAAVVATARTSADDHLTLLLAVGSDTVGDVSVVPAGSAPPNHPSPVNLTDSRATDFAELFDSLSGPGTLNLDTGSVPGVQPKVSAARVATPVMRTGGGAILKLNPPARFPRLVENESFFLTVARSCDLTTPNHVVVTDRHGRSGLVVDRFDRHVDGSGTMVRRPQEDACQVMNVYPARKYRLRTEDVVTTLADRCERGGGSATIATMQMLRLIAFSYIIGNGDLHGKNVSIRRGPSGVWEVTPAYDLVCTQPYMGWNDPMALNLYGRANRLTRAHLVEAAERWGARRRAVERMVDRLCSRLEPWLGRLDEIGFDEPTTERMRDLMLHRMNELR